MFSMAATLQQNISTIYIHIYIIIYSSLKTSFLPWGFSHVSCQFPFPFFCCQQKNRQCLGLPQADATWWSHRKIFSSRRSAVFFLGGVISSRVFSVCYLLNRLFFFLWFLGSVWWMLMMYCIYIYLLSHIHIYVFTYNRIYIYIYICM